MRIVRETSSELVIKRDKSELGASITGLSIFVVVLTIVLTGMVNSGMVQPRGNGRSAKGAEVFIFPLLIIPALLYDRRSNKKALSINTDNHIITITGSSTEQYKFADVKTFRFGRAFNDALIIELELNNGQIKNSGINAPLKSSACNYLDILEKLNCRLKNLDISEEKTNKIKPSQKRSFMTRFQITP